MGKSISPMIRLITFTCFFFIIIIFFSSCNKSNPSEPESQSIPDPVKLYLRDNDELNTEPYPTSGTYHKVTRYLYQIGGTTAKWSIALNGDLVGTHLGHGIYAQGYNSTVNISVTYTIGKQDGSEVELLSEVFSAPRTGDFIVASYQISDPRTAKGDIFIVKFECVGGNVALIHYDGAPPGYADSYIEIPGGGL